MESWFHMNKKKQRKPRTKIDVTFHALRIAIKNTLKHKGTHMASTFYVDQYCRGEYGGGTSGYYRVSDAEEVEESTTESELIDALKTTFNWDNFEILKLLPIIRKRKEYFKKKLKERDTQGYRPRRFPYHDQIDWMGISPGGTIKKAKDYLTKLLCQRTKRNHQ
jgi:hypothetical protein